MCETHPVEVSVDGGVQECLRQFEHAVSRPHGGLENARAVLDRLTGEESKLDQLRGLRVFLC